MSSITSQQADAFRQARLARDKRFDGSFFVAVKTTGIFCRPICPAPSPKESNVSYFTMAQTALEQGYRPCLRCRPDSAPGSFAWKGVDTTLERAIKLIRQSPETDLSTLAERLGISDRYLRDLFKRKLGLSPKKFQVYEKLLFAKQLLHQSGLPIEHVAQASGFSSSRRLQETMQRYIKLTPSQIRKQEKTASSEQLIRLNLSFRPPYDWPMVRDFLKMRALPGIEHVDDVSYSRTFHLGKAKGWLKATYDQPASQFRIELDIDNLAEIRPVIINIQRVLDLDARPDVIRDALLRTGVPENNLLNGIRIPGVWDSFEAGCRAILGQQVSVKGAITTMTNLVSRLGEKSEQHTFFPIAQAIAEDDLGWLALPGRRRQTLRDFAAYCAENPDASPDSWLDIKGIGPWTVAYAKMRGLSEPDIFLGGDLIIKKVLARESINQNEASPWGSYLTLQLWSMS